MTKPLTREAGGAGGRGARGRLRLLMQRRRARRQDEGRSLAGVRRGVLRRSDGAGYSRSREGGVTSDITRL